MTEQRASAEEKTGLRRLVLASGSPRRRELLASVGLTFDVEPAGIDEDDYSADLSPAAIAEQLALRKAEAVAARRAEAVVLAADTLVVLPETGELLAKPAGAEDAAAMLGRLSSRCHDVITGFSIVCRSGGTSVTRHVRTTVEFADRTPEQIAAYVATGHPMDKAGAYGIQGVGAFLVREVRGSYTNVVGLPLAEVVDELARSGLWQPALLALV